MIFEDAHWTDPTSLELFGRAVDRIASLRVLLIVTFRPEFAPPWIGRPHVTALTINRLAQRDIDAMIDGVVGNKPIPASVRQDIIERTDGIPLFVEEMTKSVLEAVSEGEAQRTAAAIPSPTLAVPASLQASLMARLDRLGTAKEVAQIGAAIRREFSHALLAAVIRKPEAELGAALDRLIGAGLLFRQGVPPHASYLFKHALVQDAAYGTLLREPRRALHARIAETLERQFAEIAESQPEFLARHCTEAGLIEKAAGLWGKAGQRSLARSALVEAAEQLTRALELISTLLSTPELRREEIGLQVALIGPLGYIKGLAARETVAAIERARLLIEQAEALGETPDDPLLLFSIMLSFWAASYVAFNGDRMRQLASQFLALAEKQANKTLLATGHRLVGTSLLVTGNLEASRKHLDRAITLYDPAAHRALAMRFLDARVLALAARCVTLWMLGSPKAALLDVEHALTNARRIGQVALLMYAEAYASLPLIFSGSYAKASMIAEELVKLADETHTAYWQAFGAIHQGAILSLTGNAADAVGMIAAGIAKYQSTGSSAWLPLFFSHLARAHLELSQFDECSRYIGEAMMMSEMNKETFCQPEINRITGELAVKESDIAKAQWYYDRALLIARQQCSKCWELRAAMSMARLWRDQGKREEARALLAPVYGWFTEGFDTLDLREAKALLDELAA